MTFRDLADSYLCPVYRVDDWADVDSLFLEDSAPLTPGVYLQNSGDTTTVLFTVYDENDEASDALQAALAMDGRILAFIQRIPESERIHRTRIKRRWHLNTRTGRRKQWRSPTRGPSIR